MKNWLVEVIGFLDDKRVSLGYTEHDIKEYNRLKAKRDGLNVCLDYMKNTERIRAKRS
jgi:hypothetical protein